MDELLLIVERVGTVVSLRKENQDLREALEDKFSFGGILGSNTRMRAVLEKIKLVAATDSTGPDSWGKRDRQRARRKCRTSKQSPSRLSFDQGELCRSAGNLARGRVIRS